MPQIQIVHFELKFCKIKSIQMVIDATNPCDACIAACGRNV